MRGHNNTDLGQKRSPFWNVVYVMKILGSPKRKKGLLDTPDYHRSEVAYKRLQEKLESQCW